MNPTSEATRATRLRRASRPLAVIAVLVAATLIGWAGIGAAVVLHEGSTMIVVLNSLRLLAYAPQQP